MGISIEAEALPLEEETPDAEVYEYIKRIGLVHTE